MSSSTSDEPNGTDGHGRTEQKPAGSPGQPERVDEPQPNGQDGPSSSSAAPPKPGIMARLGLDPPTMIMMVKYAL
jgi:hypothetical protein